MADERYDDTTRKYLANMGVPSSESSSPVRQFKTPPTNTVSGISGLAVRDMPYLEGTNTRGFVLGSNAVDEEMNNRKLQPNIFVNPKADNQTIGHEAEHLLARQNLGFAQLTREKFRELLEKNGTNKYDGTRTFLNGLKESLPYLKDKYGIKNGYMNKDFIDEQGHVGLYEILATLGGAESSLGVDLTKDPELRKTLFKDKSIREAYNAVTGLRQTRLDPRDLPPYTIVEEPSEPGMLSKFKKALGFAKGGMVDKSISGGSKLI
jgi:hypothetical protein